MMTSVRAYPILWFCGFILLTAVQAHAQELYLKSGPIAAGASMTVGDLVVTMNGGAPGADAPLLNAPLPELSAIPALIPARDIRAAIAPILRRSIVIVGGPLVYLPATVTDKSEIRFYEALLDHLGRHLPDVRIEAAIPEGRSPDLSGIQGALQFQLPGGEDSASALLRNRFVEYRGEYDADWSFVPIRFRAFVLTPVAKQRIAVGSRFSGADVDYAEIDARALHGAPAPLSSGSYQADATIDQGAPIFADMVRVIHAIRSGERINVSFSRGSIEVTVPGTAFSSGNIGDLISVAPLSGAKRFSGTIVSPSEVRVDD